MKVLICILSVMATTCSAGIFGNLFGGGGGGGANVIGPSAGPSGSFAIGHKTADHFNVVVHDKNSPHGEVKSVKVVHEGTSHIPYVQNLGPQIHHDIGLSQVHHGPAIPLHFDGGHSQVITHGNHQHEAVNVFQQAAPLQGFANTGHGGIGFGGGDQAHVFSNHGNQGSSGSLDTVGTLISAGAFGNSHSQVIGGHGGIGFGGGDQAHVFNNHGNLGNSGSLDTVGTLISAGALGHSHSQAIGGHGGIGFGGGDQSHVFNNHGNLGSSGSLDTVGTLISAGAFGNSHSQAIGGHGSIGFGGGDQAHVFSNHGNQGSSGSLDTVGTLISAGALGHSHSQAIGGHGGGIGGYGDPRVVNNHVSQGDSGTLGALIGSGAFSNSQSQVGFGSAQGSLVQSHGHNYAAADQGHKTVNVIHESSTIYGNGAEIQRDSGNNGLSAGYNLDSGNTHTIVQSGHAAGVEQAIPTHTQVIFKDHGAATYQSYAKGGESFKQSTDHGTATYQGYAQGGGESLNSAGAQVIYHDHGAESYQGYAQGGESFKQDYAQQAAGQSHEVKTIKVIHKGTTHTSNHGTIPVVSLQESHNGQYLDDGVKTVKIIHEGPGRHHVKTIKIIHENAPVYQQQETKVIHEHAAHYDASEENHIHSQAVGQPRDSYGNQINVPKGYLPPTQQQSDNGYLPPAIDCDHEH